MNCADAIRETTAEHMRADPNVVVLGLGVHDDNAVFGTCAGLKQEFGDERVLEMPNMEVLYTGFAQGLAIAGKRPIVIFQRNEFMLYAMSQIVNHAAPWHFLTNQRLPIVYRCIIGKGWGQGPQHSGAYHHMLVNVPDIEVYMPAWPTNAAWLMGRAIVLDKPVVMFECKSLYESTWDPEKEEKAEKRVFKKDPDEDDPEIQKMVKAGQRIPNEYGIIALGDMVPEAVKAGEWIAARKKRVAVHSVTILKPLDVKDIQMAVYGAHTIVVCDIGNPRCSYASELISSLAIHGVKASFRKVTRPDAHTPAAAHLERKHYPTWRDIVVAAGFERPAGEDEPVAIPKEAI